MNKRIISMLLALVMALSLAACGKPSSSSSSAAEEAITLTFGVRGMANVTEYDDNKLIQWLEEKSGYELDVKVFASDPTELASQVATMVAGGEKLPDIMFYFDLPADVRDIYGKDGYLEDLLPYFSEENVAKLEAKYDFNVLRYIEKNLDPVTASRLFTEGLNAEGKMWGYPSVGHGSVGQETNMVYINTNWLDKLGLEMPTTTAELENVLTQFVTKDPNGNGKPDEMGMIGSISVARGDIATWLINNYIYYNDKYMFNCDDNGKIYLPYDRDEYREGIAWAASMFEKGLLPELSWTVKKEELPALFTPADEVAKVGVWSGYAQLRTTADNPVVYEYEPLPPLKDAQPATNPLECYYKALISGESEHPDKAFEILYLLTTPEGYLRMASGEEGVDWYWGEPGAPDCPECGGKQYMGLGKEVWTNDTDAYSGQTDSTFSLICCQMTYEFKPLTNPDQANRDVPITHGCVAPDDGVMTTKKYVKQIQEEHATKYLAVGNANNPKNMVTTLLYNGEETEKRGNYETDLKSYVQEMRAKFISGELDVNDDAVWKNYVDTAHSLGWDVLVSCAQSAWDR